MKTKRTTLPPLGSTYMKFISVAILTLTDSFNSSLLSSFPSQCDQLNRKFEARLVIERFIPREGEQEKVQCDCGKSAVGRVSYFCRI